MGFISKTFGGLSKAYYFRNCLFGLPLYILFVVLMTKQGTDLSANGIFAVIMLTIMQFLYPYSRFVYESIVDFIMGDTVFFINIISFLWTKFASVVLCWVFGIFIAPIGLLYLYFYHSKQEKKHKVTEKQEG